MNWEPDQFLEFSLIGAAILGQLYLFTLATLKIIRYRKEFTDVPAIQETSLNSPYVDPDSESQKVKLLSNRSKKDTEPKLVGLINKYLLNNRGALIDFHFIKELVDRRRHTEEEAIEAYLPSPLYFGLAATMIGIIFGLFGIDFETTDVGAIKPLIEGVKVAMLASVCGLVLTTVLAVFIYRSAKTKVDQGVNELLSLIQIELLPSFYSDDTQAISTLSQKLDEFGRTTASNLSEIVKLVENSNKQVQASQDVVTKIENLDLSNLANANVKTFRQLSKMIDSFTSFPEYYAKLNDSLGKTSELIGNLSLFLKRSEQVSLLFEQLKQINEDSQNASNFFKEHLESFSKYGKTVNKAVEASDEKMQAAIAQFGKRSEELIKGINTQMHTYDEKFSEIIQTSSAKFITKAEEQRDAMLNSLTNHEPEFAHLSHLVDIKTGMGTLNSNFQEFNNSLQAISKELNESNTRGQKELKSLQELVSRGLNSSDSRIESHGSFTAAATTKSKLERALLLVMYALVSLTCIAILGTIIYSMIVSG